jgi:ferric-dicitrate binding protein FerR (iron transport regulator)
VAISLLTVGALALANRLNRVTVVAGTDEARKQIVLPDKTVVTLNADSRISYKKNFNNPDREVHLTGEAFFEVTPDPSAPFVVAAGQARVRVVGTDFNVETDHTDGHVEVFVYTGLVEVSSTDNRQGQVMLRPGDMGILNKTSGLTREAGDENCIAWKTGKLVFTDTRLDEVREILNDVYGVSIEFRQSTLDSTRINGSYSNDSLDQILKVICTQNHLKLEKSENKIYLSE